MMVLIMNNPSDPKRGEVWKVSLDPTLGSEMKKTRPAIIISSNALGVLPMKLIVPITAWNDKYQSNIWHIRISPDTTNGLTKVSAADALQLRAVSVERCIQKIG